MMAVALKADFRPPVKSAWLSGLFITLAAWAAGLLPVLLLGLVRIKVLTADNVVQYLGNDIYFEFEDDNSARKEYQAEIATDLLERAIALVEARTAAKAITA